MLIVVRTASRRSRRRTAGAVARSLLALAACLLGIVPALLQGQDESGKLATDSITAAEPKYPNTTAGEFTPAKGFDIVKTKRASLNISFYGLFRYVNQLPGTQTFTDH